MHRTSRGSGAFHQANSLITSVVRGLRLINPIRIWWRSMSAMTRRGLAQQTSGGGPYKVLKTAKVGGDGGFDYISADSEGRRLLVPRNGPNGRVSIYDLDTLNPTGEVAMTACGGAVVDPKSGHGFATTKPVQRDRHPGLPFLGR